MLAILAGAFHVVGWSADGDPARLFAALAGSWQGTLQYRDYQSHRLEEIPMAVRFSSRGNDGIVEHASFRDPGREVVTITESSFTTGGTRRRVSFQRDGRTERYEQTVRVAEAVSLSHWTLVLEHRGLDDNRPARIRETVVRQSNRLRVEKQVAFDGDSRGFRFRNRMLLTKSP